MTAGDTATLVLGGARSGKSRFAETIAEASEPQPVYIATAEVQDAEMAHRVEQHRLRRGSRWRTCETSRSLPAALEQESRPGNFVLVDSISMWIANLLFAEADVENELDRFIASLLQRQSPVILVSDEVGLGIVPDNRLSRHFRDWAGTANQRIAACADEVFFIAAGLPIRLKPQ